MNIQKIKIDKLIPATYNPRKDLKPEDNAYQRIKKSIINYGCVIPLVVNKDMTVIAGHQRIKILKDLGYTEIECVVVDYEKSKEKGCNIVLNNEKVAGEWDSDKLEELIAELKKEDNFDMEMTGFSFDEIDDILKDVIGSKEDEFDIDETINEIKEPVTKRGDIWILGKHRLMCGDSTQKREVMRLMSNQKADMILTDPPYNVDYSSKNEMLNHSDKGNSIQIPIENDKKTEIEFYNFLLDSFRNLSESTKLGGSAYVFHSDAESLNFRNAFKATGFKYSQCLIWVKNNFVLGRQDYQGRYEPCLYGWKEGAAHYFIDDRSQSTVLEYDKPLKNDLHPTMKPIDLLCRLIKNSSKESELIIDFFGGSGSTLIAAEQLNRKCYMMELDPKYCDVIVKRWETLTNQEAILDTR